MVEGCKTTLADHFQMLDWLLNALDTSKNKFTELSEDTARRPDADAWLYLANCASTAWKKCEKYYLKADTESPAYYASILLNPQVKGLWFEETWRHHDAKQTYIQPALDAVNKYWQECYRGQTSHISMPSSSEPMPTPAPRAPLIYTSAREHKRLKRSHNPSTMPATDFYTQYLESTVLSSEAILEGKLNGDLNTTGDLLSADNVIRWWNDRYYTQPDLARFALDILAVPPMSDDCERLFSGASILLDKRRRRLGIDIIEANECLRCTFPSAKDAYYDPEVAHALGAAMSSPSYHTLHEQAAARLRASCAAEEAYHATEDIAREQRDAEDEVVFEGPVIDADDESDNGEDIVMPGVPETVD